MATTVKGLQGTTGGDAPGYVTNVMLSNFRRHGAHNLEDGLGFLIVDLEVVHFENPEGHSYLIHAIAQIVSTFERSISGGCRPHRE